MDPTLLAEQTQVAVIRSIGTDIIWVSPGGAQQTLKAFLGKTQNDNRDAGQMSRNITRTHTTDFIIPTEDLPDASTRGVELIFGALRYRPVSNSGEPPTVVTPHGLLTRIHTVKV